MATMMLRWVRMPAGPEVKLTVFMGPERGRLVACGHLSMTPEEAQCFRGTVFGELLTARQRRQRARDGVGFESIIESGWMSPEDELRATEAGEAAPAAESDAHRLGGRKAPFSQRPVGTEHLPSRRDASFERSPVEDELGLNDGGGA
jgi:hypothetical protein